MIKSFRHKGLELFFVTGNKKGIKPEHGKKIARIFFFRTVFLKCLLDLQGVPEVVGTHVNLFKL